MNTLNSERWQDLSEFSITFQEIMKLRLQSNQFQGIESVKNGQRFGLAGNCHVRFKNA